MENNAMTTLIVAAAVLLAFTGMAHAVVAPVKKVAVLNEAGNALQLPAANPPKAMATTQASLNAAAKPAKAHATAQAPLKAITGKKPQPAAANPAKANATPAPLKKPANPATPHTAATQLKASAMKKADLPGFLSPYNPANALPLIARGIDLKSQVARDAAAYKGGVAKGGGARLYVKEVLPGLKNRKAA